ncbi:hypothetical protein NDA15_004100 [Ustilago hordei]|nr:hypothetical protein NDA15_004100 [Ustilago hordei]
MYSQVILDSTSRQICLVNGMLLKMVKDYEQGLLEFQGDTWQENTMIMSTSLFEDVNEDFEQAEGKAKISKQQLWHEHLGHPGQDKTRAIINCLKDNNTADLDPDTAMTFNSSHATEYMCTLVLVNDHSKYVYMQPLLQKSHAFPKLKTIVSYLKTQTGRSLKAIQSDQGTEWRSNDALEWTHDKGIEWQMTMGYNSRQNRCVERMNRSLGEKMQTLLMQRRLPKSFWPYAIQATAFKMNLTPNIDSKFPYQAMFGKPLEQLMRLLHVFRCLAWVNIPKVKRDNKKLDQ